MDHQIIAASSRDDIGPGAAIEETGRTGTLVLMLDDGWPSARTWNLRVERARAALERAENRPVLVNFVDHIHRKLEAFRAETLTRA